MKLNRLISVIMTLLISSSLFGQSYCATMNNSIRATTDFMNYEVNSRVNSDKNRRNQVLNKAKESQKKRVKIFQNSKFQDKNYSPNSNDQNLAAFSNEMNSSFKAFIKVGKGILEFIFWVLSNFFGSSSILRETLFHPTKKDNACREDKGLKEFVMYRFEKIEEKNIMELTRLIGPNYFEKAFKKRVEDAKRQMENQSSVNL